MEFELHITCTRSIDKLQIDFSDGTTAVSSSSERSSGVSIHSENLPHKKEQFLDTDQEFNPVAQEIVTPPSIPIREERKINVAPELQNLDI